MAAHAAAGPAARGARALRGGGAAEPGARAHLHPPGARRGGGRDRRLRARGKRQRPYQSARFRPAAPFSRLHFARVPAVGQTRGLPFTLEYFVEALAQGPAVLDRQDPARAVVARLGDAEHPRTLTRVPPEPAFAAGGEPLVPRRRWYERRWLWVAAGVAVTGAIVAGGVSRLRHRPRRGRAPAGAVLLRW
jgi:hypothetical protein